MNGKHKKNFYPQMSALFLYIIAAIAFECTASTARIATIAIYLVFLVGVLFFASKKVLYKNINYLMQILLFLDILVMSNVNQNYMSNTIVYLYLTCMVLCVITYHLVRSNTDLINYILYAYILGSIVLSVRIINSYGGILSMLSYSSVIGERRIGGTVVNENTLGLMMANAVICCLIMSVVKRNKKILSRALICISPYFIMMLLLTGSKKAIAFLVIGCVILGLYLLRDVSNLKKIFVLIGMVALGYALVYVIRNISAFYTINMRLNEMIGTILGDSQYSNTDASRIMMTTRGIEAFMNSPFFGNGTGYSYILFGTYSHNNFVELLMNYGLVGFILYYFPYLVLLKRLYVRMRERDLYALYFTIFISLQIVLGVGWVNYYERVIQLLTMVAWAYIDGSKGLEEEYET